MFKHDWEKTQQYTKLPENILNELLAYALPNRAYSYELISGGCANINIKIALHDTRKTCLLRMYLRDKDAAYREQKVAQLIKQCVPVAQIYTVGDYKNYRYALIEYMPGITLRDLLLNYTAAEWQEPVYQAGKLLALFQKYQFSSSGFFNSDLDIIQPLDTQEYYNFARKSLESPWAIKYLSQEKIAHIKTLLEKFKYLFPSSADAHLVHGDYDPANILVHKINNSWKISAILDWEFVFSGSWLIDVSNMLRYAHCMPKVFETNFIKGITDAGLKLPDNWKITTHLLNLLSLLDCLIRSNPKERPKQAADILNLIDNIIKQLGQVET